MTKGERTLRADGDRQLAGSHVLRRAIRSLIVALVVAMPIGAVTGASSPTERAAPAVFGLGAATLFPPRETVYVTTADASRLFARDDAPRFATTIASGVPMLTVDETRRYQEVRGFGAELTGSSAYLVDGLPDHGAAVVRDLFDDATGAGLSYVRLTIGASDFSLGSSTYDDVAPGATDPTLAAFSLRRDEQVVRVARAIVAVDPIVGFMASPWTAPAWMKVPPSLMGGRLDKRYYGVYGTYLASYVRAMRRHGVALDAVTPQNEPLLDTHAYPSMTMSARDEAEFVATALGPALRAAAPSTKILVDDHNWDSGAYASTVLGDAAASAYVAGTAFHCYGGDVAAMADVARAFPAKSVALTECSGGAWSPHFGDNLAWDVRNLVVGAMTSGARVVVLGNLALDEADGPVNGGCTDCRGVLTVRRDGSVERNVEYYVLEHVAKFVRPGAVRIGTSSDLGTALPNVAFRNFDGSTVVVALDDTKAPLDFAIAYHGRYLRYTLPAGAVATFAWM